MPAGISSAEWDYMRTGTAPGWRPDVNGVVEGLKKVPGMKIFGKSIPELVTGALVGGTLKTAVRAGLLGAGFGGWAATIIGGGASGAIIAGGREGYRQAAENWSKGLSPEADTRKKKILERMGQLKPNDWQKLGKAAGRGALFGMVGGLAGAAIADYFHVDASTTHSTTPHDSVADASHTAGADSGQSTVPETPQHTPDTSHAAGSDTSHPTGAETNPAPAADTPHATAPDAQHPTGEADATRGHTPAPDASHTVAPEATHPTGAPDASHATPDATHAGPGGQTGAPDTSHVFSPDDHTTGADATSGHSAASDGSHAATPGAYADTTAPHAPISPEASLPGLEHVPTEYYLHPGDNPWSVTETYLKQVLGRNPTPGEILRVTQRLAWESKISVPEWNIGGLGFTDAHFLPGSDPERGLKGFKLVFNDKVRSVISDIVKSNK